MNIMFFLKPKSEVAHIYDDDTVRQVLERMEYRQIFVYPNAQQTGKICWEHYGRRFTLVAQRKSQSNLKLAEMVSIQEVGRRLDYKPVRAEAKMEDLMEKAMEQNFVPVVDD